MASLREQIEKHPRVTAMVAGTVLMLTISWALLRETRQPGIYFYDTGSGTVYVAPAGTLPPTKAPSGSEGVLAIVLSCGDCAEESSRFVGYLQSFTDEYRRALASGDEITEKLLFEGQLFRAVDDETWHSDGPEAAAIVQNARNRCEKDSLTTCRPM